MKKRKEVAGYCKTYEDDLYFIFLGEDEPCFPDRKAFLLYLYGFYPEEFAKFREDWPEEIARDTEGAIPHFTWDNSNA